MDNLSQILLLGLGVSLPLFVSTCREVLEHTRPKILIHVTLEPCGLCLTSQLSLYHRPLHWGTLGDPVLPTTMASSPDLKTVRGVSRMLGPTKKRYPTSKGQRRSPSKMVGGVESHLESNPIPTRDAQKAQTNLACTGTQRPQRD